MIDKILLEIHDVVLFNAYGNNIEVPFGSVTTSFNFIRIKIPIFGEFHLYKDHFVVEDYETKNLSSNVSYTSSDEELFHLSTTNNLFDISIDSINKLWYIKRKLLGE